MNLLVTGGSGQLGRAMVRVGSGNHNIYAPGSSQLDVTDFRALQHTIAERGPDLVIHAGAMTDVDGCERDPVRAFRINGLGTQNLAAATASAGIPLVYVSTNFVFDGQLGRAYTEFDQPAPISVYGRSKLAGEHAVRALNPRHFIVRTAMVFDESGKNFVNSMVRLASEHPTLRIVDDQWGNPTYAADLAFGILALIEQPSYGTFHLTNRGTASWYEWATATFERLEIDTNVEPIPASQFQRAATPPANGALENLAASALGIELPDWEDALSRCLARRAEIST
jgi:dTDP-4-dehydrorhamnose reductase